MGAGPADFDPAGVSALISNWSRSRAGLNLAELAPVSPSQFGQQPRCQFGPGPGQRAKQMVVRVLVEQSWDACTVVSQLLLQGLQQSGQTLDQQTLSSGDRLSTAKGRSPGENFHALRRGLWTPQFVAVKELLPFTLTGRRQRLGRGKGQHKGPSVRGGPVIESFQCRRVILLESGLELVDQGSALLNQCDFIPTESAQLARQGIQRRESAPALSVGAQRIGQTPSVVPIIVAAGGPFAFAVACSRLGHDRINHTASLEQLIDGGAGAGLDGHGQTGPSGQGLLSLLPAFGVVGEGQLQCDLPLGIDHDQIVVIVGPIQGRKVRQFSPCFHWFRASGLKASFAGRSRSNTTALLGQSSLSDWPASRRRGQSSCHDPRRVRCACLCPRRGQLFRQPSLRRRRVIHNLALRARTGSPRSVVHNFGKRIRCAPPRLWAPSGLASPAQELHPQPMKSLERSLLVCLVLVAPSISALAHSAVEPVPRGDQGWKDRQDLLNKRAAEAGEKAQVVFIGDSITQGWEGEGK